MKRARRAHCAKVSPALARPSNALPFSGLGAAKPTLRFYADASAATRSAATACWAAAR
jgi:hypothetical protein